MELAEQLDQLLADPAQMNALFQLAQSFLGSGPDSADGPSSHNGPGESSGPNGPEAPGNAPPPALARPTEKTTPLETMWLSAETTR